MLKNHVVCFEAINFLLDAVHCSVTTKKLMTFFLYALKNVNMSATKCTDDDVFKMKVTKTSNQRCNK